MTSVVMIHTVPVLIEMFDKLSAELLPDVQILHILDEVILRKVHLNKGTALREKEWLGILVRNAEEIGASAILVTCTILSTCVDELRPNVGIPIVKIDEMMIEKALSLGEKIAVIATNQDTLEPSTQLVLEYAIKKGKKVDVKSFWVEKAFDAIRQGDTDTHDRLVKKKIAELAPKYDVIILAQASMARVVDTKNHANEYSVPILSSPHFALLQLKHILDSRNKTSPSEE